MKKRVLVFLFFISNISGSGYEKPVVPLKVVIDKRTEPEQLLKILFVTSNLSLTLDYQKELLTIEYDEFSCINGKPQQYTNNNSENNGDQGTGKSYSITFRENFAVELEKNLQFIPIHKRGMCEAIKVKDITTFTNHFLVESVNFIKIYNSIKLYGVELNNKAMEQNRYNKQSSKIKIRER